MHIDLRCCELISGSGSIDKLSSCSTRAHRTLESHPHASACFGPVSMLCRQCRDCRGTKVDSISDRVRLAARILLIRAPMQRSLRGWLEPRGHDLFAHDSQKRQQPPAPCIQVVMGARVTGVAIPASNAPAIVTATVRGMDGTEDTVKYTGRLIVGADGANSTVRQALQHAQPGTGWEMRKRRSDSAGIAWKVRSLHACVCFLWGSAVRHSLKRTHPGPGWKCCCKP